MNEDFLQQKNKAEIDYISIMLNNSYYVGEHIDSNIPYQYFEEYNRIILKSIIYYYEKNIAVTENSFKEYLKHLSISNSEKLTLLEVFDKISFNINNEKDFIFFRQKIIDFYISQKSVNILDEYSKSLKENNKITALKKLAAELTDLVTDNFSAKEMIYASIETLAEDFKKQFEESKSDEKLGIFTGIKTIDDILDTGLYPGSITLFCGEVSGYKCLSEDSKILTCEEGILSIKDIFDRVNYGKKIHVYQLSNKTMKLEKKLVLDAFDKGFIECFKIKTFSGYEIECTGKHRNLFFDGYKRTEDVIIGDYVATVRDVNTADIKIESKPNTDIIPQKVWDLIYEKLKYYGKDNIYDLENNGESMTRAVLKKIAHYLNEDSELMAIAESDVLWDKVINIETVGIKHTYDLSLPDSHNFVANNIVTHNSTMMLNVGLNAWKHQKKRVLYIPLEMPWYLCYCKMISRETKIPFEYLIRPSKIGESDSSEIKEKKVEEVILKINKEIEEWNKSEIGKNMWMMDSLSERTKVSTIKREIEKNIDIFRPDLVIIDYIANLTPDKTRQGRNDLEIGDMISDLSHMGHYLNFAVVSGAQIGREALKRFRSSSGTNSSFHSEDIRGSHEYAAEADFVFAQMIDPQNNNSLLITPIKNRFGKKVFEDGSSKASLAIQPNIGLIESDSKFITCSPSEIASIASNPAFVDDLSFDDDDDDDSSSKNILDDNIKKEDLIIEKNSIADKYKQAKSTKTNKSGKKNNSMDIFL